MNNIIQYFDITYSLLSLSEGIIRGVFYFADESRLHIVERVKIYARRPVKLRYRYQYLRDNENIFRYDNSPHHPHLPTFPHHKHEGTRLIAASEPSLQQVIEEIDSLFLTSKVARSSD